MARRIVIEPRTELSRAVGPLFADGRPGKWDLIDAAIRGRVHPTILITLVDLPDRPYRSLTDLFTTIQPIAGDPPTGER